MQFTLSIAYQVMSNHNEPQTIWFDNSQLKSLPMNSSTGDYSRSSNSSNGSSSDVILIDDDNSNDEFNENSNGGLTHEPSNGSTEQKMYSCNICHSKLSSSYNLKRHMMIHTGKRKTIHKTKPQTSRLLNVFCFCFYCFCR